MCQRRGNNKTKIAIDTAWFNRIQEAIREDKFVLVYQPILDSAVSDRECYEVLLRLPGPDGEMALPSIFLPVAQRFGLMADIDRWVIVHALKALAIIRTSGREVVFSINLSGQSLEEMSFLQFIKDQIALNHLPPGCVIFEITEQSALRHMENARRLIQGLRDYGCRFALDDFGSGFSSFAYLT